MSRTPLDVERVPVEGVIVGERERAGSRIEFERPPRQGSEGAS
jgi:hypothetical protein